MQNSQFVQVLISGAGPSGTALAIDLARRGVTVRIIDQEAHGFQGSRAKGVSPRTLEVFDDLDVVDEVLAQGGLYPKMGVHLGPLTLPKTMIRNGEPSSGVPYPNTWLIPQHRTIHILHSKLAEHGVNIEFNKKLTAFQQAESEVIATITGADGGTETVTASFLVGADGGASFVRKELEIDFLGSTDEDDRMLIVDAVTSGLPRDRWHVWPGRKGRFVGACPLPQSDLFQWMIRLAEGELEPTTLEEINQRVQAKIRKPQVQLTSINWKSVWRPNIRLADKYADQRVFLVGDAAHVHPPTGGLGMNTGIQDAYNLGWKLSQVLSGAPSTLLGTYEQERQPIAAGVLGLASEKYDALTKNQTSALKRGDAEKQLGVSYRGGPLAAALSDSPVQAGDRAPGATLDRNGRHIPLFNLLRGPHFTAIGYGPTATRVLDQLSAPENSAALKCITVTKTPVDSSSESFTDVNESLRQNYNLGGDAIILIRPDGYIANIATTDMVASTQSWFDRITPQ